MSIRFNQNKVKIEVAEFIQTHAQKSNAELALLLSKRTDLPKEYIINQINGKQKSPSKFPFLTAFPNYTFPSPRAFSQASSEKTAKYKAGILKANKVLDLSGGMGMDSYFFSQHASYSDYIELNETLVETAKSNFETLNASSIHCHHSSAEDFIAQTTAQYDLVYLDPDRRSAKEKAFRIDDCEPNVAELLPQIWTKSTHCIIKLSPMLDITQALNELENCKAVYVISVENDCKELLFLLEKDFVGESIIYCENILKTEQQSFNFNLQSEKDSITSFIDISNYLYEPNASVLKSGAFKSVANHFGVNKLATHTHLYTSTDLVQSFPGRKLRVIEVSKPKKGLIEKANVICRNYSMNPDQLKKKYKIKDGGNMYLYACSLADGTKQFILCELVN